MKRFIAALLILTLPSVTFADGLKHLPAWHMKDGQACYFFNDAKALVLIDADLDALMQKQPVWEQMQRDMETQVLNLTAALAASNDAKATLQSGVASLNLQLIAEITRANNAEAKKMPSPGWLVAGGVILVALGLGIGVGLAKAIK